MLYIDKLSHSLVLKKLARILKLISPSPSSSAWAVEKRMEHHRKLHIPMWLNLSLLYPTPSLFIPMPKSPLLTVNYGIGNNMSIPETKSCLPPDLFIYLSFAR